VLVNVKTPALAIVAPVESMMTRLSFARWRREFDLASIFLKTISPSHAANSPGVLDSHFPFAQNLTSATVARQDQSAK
jgi:hypothetical protein